MESKSNSARHRINVPLLVGTIVLCIVVALAGYFWHRRQVDSMAGNLLVRATSYEEKGDYRAAAQHVFRYLQFRPLDHEARVRLAKTYDECKQGGAGHVQAIEYYHRAIGVAPPEDQIELRTRVIKLQLEIGRYVAAENDATELLTRFENHATYADIQKGSSSIKSASEVVRETWRHLALALNGQRVTGQLEGSNRNEGTSLGQAVAAAILLNPHDIELPPLLSFLYRQLPKHLSEEQRTLDVVQTADSIVNQMVARNQNSAPAYIARYRYRARYGLVDAELDLEKALELAAEDDAQTVFVAAKHFQEKAESFRAAGKDHTEVAPVFTRARKLFERINEIDESLASGYVGVGQIEMSLENPADAIKTWEFGLTKTDKLDPTLNGLIAEQYIVMGKLEPAKSAIANVELYRDKFSARMRERDIEQWRRGLDLLNAMLHQAEGEAKKAIGLAKPIVASDRSSAEEIGKGWSIIARSYASLGQWDLAGGAYEKVIEYDKGNWKHRLAAANAWWRAGQPRKAVDQFERALKLGDSAELRFQLAKARLAYQSSRPPSEREWDRLSKELKVLLQPKVKKILASSWRVNLLHASYALVRQKENSNAADSEAFGNPAKILKSLESEYPDSAPMWRELVLRYERIGQSADADRALAKCRKLESDAWQNALVASQLLLTRKDYARARTVLNGALPSLTEDQKYLAHVALSRVSVAEGNVAQAYDELVELQKKSGDKIELVQQLAGLRLQMLSNPSESEQAGTWESNLLEAEGSDGTLWRFHKAKRLLMNAANGSGVQGESFREAVRLQTEIHRRRPSWASTYVLKAMIEEMQGNREQAVHEYRTAVSLGSGQIGVYQRFVDLLDRLGRSAEAREYLVSLGDVVSSSESLSALAIRIETGAGDLDRAETYAKEWQKKQPQDPRARIWLSELLRLNKQPELAQKKLQEAKALDGKDVKTWSALFRFQMLEGKTDEARKTLNDMVDQCELEGVQREFVLGQGHEMLGDFDEAKVHYEKALLIEGEGEDEGDNLGIVLRLAMLNLRHFPDDAVPSLREVIDLAGESESTRPIADRARRTLAAYLASRGKDKDFTDAMALLKHAGVDREVAELDKRLHAILLTQRPEPDPTDQDAVKKFSENLKAAEELLQDLLLSGSTSKGDRLLLAWVYRKQGESLGGDERKDKLEDARRQYEDACRGSNEPSHLALYIDMLIDTEDWKEAEKWLNRMADVAPANARRVLLHARFYQEQGRREEIADLLKAYEPEALKATAEDKDQRPKVLALIGQLYGKYKFYEEAEALYRQAVEIDPQFYPGLALALKEQENKFDEALTLCLDRCDGTTAPVIVLISVVIKEPEKAKAPKVVKAIEAALAAHSKDTRLLLEVATLRIYEERVDEAISLYRKVLEVNPKNVYALNNLATLLSEREGKEKEALELIKNAIAISGSKPGLLDTNGMVYFHMGDYDKAVGLLSRAVDSPDVDPRYHFHLALALLHDGRKEEARVAYLEAKANDLQRSMLTDKDRSMLPDLEVLVTENGVTQQ